MLVKAKKFRKEWKEIDDENIPKIYETDRQSNKLFG